MRTPGPPSAAPSSLSLAADSGFSPSKKTDKKAAATPPVKKGQQAAVVAEVPSLESPQSELREALLEEPGLDIDR